MATQSEILEIIKSHPDGVDTPGLVKELNTPPRELSKPLTRLLAQGSIKRSKDGLFHSVASVQKPQGEPAEPLPNSFDAFLEMAGTLGLEPNFCRSLSSYVFQIGAQDDLGKLQEALRPMGLRPDIAARIVALWAGHLGLPVPKMPVSGGSDGERRYIVIGHDIQPTGDPDGLSFQQALQVLDTRSAHSDKEDGRVERLTAAFEELQQKLADAQINSLKVELSNLRETIASGARSVTGKSSYDLLSEILGKLDSKIPDKADLLRLASQLQPLDVQLRPRGPGELAEELGGLVEDMEDAANIQEEADWIFGLGDYASLPVSQKQMQRKARPATPTQTLERLPDRGPL
jgi:hypothetical protein